MKLFERTGGHWLFWTGACYFVVGMVDVFFIEEDWSPWLQIAWLTVVGSPFLYPPLGRWLNLDVEWDRKMFNLFKKKNSNVVPFPETKAVPKSEYVPPEPPKEEKPTVTYYRLGLTDNNRVSFQMGYSEITMNAQGIDNMIEQLELFRNQLREENETA